MQLGRKILMVLGIIVFIALIGAWGSIYAFADQGIELVPGKGIIVATSSPRISVSWPRAIGARLQSYKVNLDGEDISDMVEVTSSGFVYSPEELEEGGHIIEGELTYWWLFKRKIQIRSHFTTDTVIPEIKFSHSSDMIAVPESWIHSLEGATEAGSKLRIALNGKELASPNVDETGHFSLSLYQLQEKNELKVTAIDQAGNENSINIPILIDRSAPSILSISPRDNETVHAETLVLNVGFEESDSKIESSILRIDNVQVYGNFDTEKNILTYSTNTLTQGNHKASLEVSDAAGNKVSKEWAFSIDTTRLVLSLSQRRIFLYREGKLVKSYPCAVGRPEYPTPKGHWKVVGKRKNPAWYNPGSAWAASMPKVIPPGPSNPLGTRAIELNASAIRIHGTSNPGSVGHAASHGCIRMYRNDIEELFDEVSIGVPCDIVD